MPPLSHTEHLLRNLVEAAPDAMLVISSNGTIVLVNKRAEELFGYGRDEMIDRPVEMLIPERYTKQHVQDRIRYIENPTLRPMGAGRNLWARRKDGREVAVDIMLSPMKDENGITIISTVRDASERKLVEEKLATSEAMFRALYDQAPDAIVAVDKQGLIVKTNRMVKTMLGYEPEELLQQPIEVLVPERFRKMHAAQREGYSAHPRTRPMGEGIDLYARRKNGSEVPVDILLSPVQLPGSEVVISVIRDVTERKRAESQLKERAEQLVRSNKELEQFAYIASHDLQEPLRAVASSCQILQKRLAGKLDEDTDEYLHFAVDGAKRMQALIGDLLSYSRAGRGKEFEDVEVSQVLDRVVLNLEPQIQETNTKITYDKLPKVRGDFAQLVQLFQNLLSNAMKFRDGKQTEIQVVAVDTPNKWIFQVKDNGIGIPKAYQDKIFIIFQRLHRREEYPGTGIGLAICKKIVERHGGDIWVESEPGVGPTFYFTLSKLEGDYGSQAG